MNNKFKKVCFFILCCCFVFCYTFFFRGIFADEIYNYGFGYNIASGLIPYRDFNMIVTPFYSFLVAIFVKIFGHHLWAMHIFNAIVISIMLFIMYKKIGKKTLIIIPVLLLFFYPSYNFFCLFLLLILFSFIDNKRVNIYSAFLVSLLFLTKQTVGLASFVPMIYYSKNKFKSFVVFLIPIFLFLIYLIYNQALFNFIDYCFLGMFDFANDNKTYLLLPIEIIMVLILFYKNIKCKFCNVELFYILMFQIITVPIFDFSHCGISFIILFYYYISNANIDYSNIKYYSIILFFFIFWCGYLLWDISYGNNFFSDSSSYLFGRRINDYVESSIIAISDYMENIKDDYDNVYLFSSHSYEIKLNTSYVFNKFDLINNGNMGYNGVFKYINEIDERCSYESCVFILYKYEFYGDSAGYCQTNVNILNYVYSNYDYFESIDTFDIYISDKKSDIYPS